MRYSQTKFISFILTAFFIFFFGVTKAFAQYGNDLKAYHAEEDLNAKAKIGLRLWNIMMRTDLDSLRNMSLNLLFEGVEQRNDFATAVGKRSLGSSMIRTGDHDKGLKFLKQSLSYFQKIGDAVLITETLNEIGNGYLNKGLPLEAEKYYLRSLKAGKYSNDPTTAFLAEINLGQAYIGMKNYDKAIAIIQHYKNESLKNGKLEAVSSAYSLLGTIEQQRLNIPLAMEYFQKSADFGKKSSVKSQVAHALNNMAIVYFEQGDMKKTLDFFKKAMDIRIEIGNSRYIAESYFNIGGLYFEMGDMKSAEEYYQKSLDLAREKKLRKDEMDAVMAFSELYKSQGKKDKVVTLLEEYIELQDAYYSSIAAENTYSMELIETIQQLESENNLLDQKGEVKELLQSQNKVWYVVYAIGALTFIVMLVLFVFKKKIN